MTCSFTKIKSPGSQAKAGTLAPYNRQGLLLLLSVLPSSHLSSSRSPHGPRRLLRHQLSHDIPVLNISPKGSTLNVRKTPTEIPPVISTCVSHGHPTARKIVKQS